jgi:O-antigen/teichoic acid export membrane protein
MMPRQHFVLYLGSRGVAAALNLVSVAVFARLAGPEIYGHYLLVAAWAMIVFGFSAQWACAAFFATYSEHHAENHIASFVLLIVGVLTAFGLGAIGAGLFGSVDAPFLAALFAMATGLTMFEAAIDVARTRLESGRVATSVLLRAVATLTIGVTAIAWEGTATALALAVAAANVLASLPCLFRYIPYVWRQASVITAGHLFRYGWPLILAFGVSALGQNIDRLFLGAWIGTRELGPYGAISDLIKQTFFVVGESISLAFVSLAKRSATAGDHAHAAAVLETAFTSLVAVAAFGAAFFLCFGPFIFTLVFGPDFARLAAGYFPILVLGNVFLTLRSFYFSQVIYFSESSRLELWVSTVTLAVSAALSALLIPRIGTLGAAISLLAGQATACVAFAIMGRRAYHLPVPIRRGLAIFALVGGFLLVAALVDRVAPTPLIAQAINVTLLAASALFAVRRFKLFGVHDVGAVNLLAVR